MNTRKAARPAPIIAPFERMVSKPLKVGMALARRATGKNEESRCGHESGEGPVRLMAESKEAVN